jgi:hypothetical protein
VPKLKFLEDSVKLVLFSDLDGRPVYVNADGVTYLTKRSEEKTAINFERDHFVEVDNNIQNVAESLDPRSGPSA